jgi:tetratricopeptide (TPR) repeat protein
MNRAHAESSLGKWDKVLADSGKAISLNPNLAPAYYHRSEAYTHLKKPDLAKADLEKAKSLGWKKAEENK